jgi:fluoride exporter
LLQILSVAAGGATGALLRFWMSNSIHAWLGRGFPYGTIVVNILGSLVMGILYVLIVERMEISAEWRAALVVGLLGAFTTFSAFSLETIHLLEASEFTKAGLNILLSVSLCIAACWLGMMLTRHS